ncbi:hypothetical protein EVAR_18599_1 [Eumeta japonica]|uniref:Uncharacterized protein n=1 Tax=Eumeta variegata TaxID=151549 RepID=A0A4C1V2S0_EUMVA|nr:hypothetical protein EVAR_18599_1 [Eumeta japonica]
MTCGQSCASYSCGGSRTCIEATGTLQQTQKPVCGRRHPDGVGFYYNGQHTADDVKFAEFPWMVALLRRLVKNTISLGEKKLSSRKGRHAGSCLKILVVHFEWHLVPKLQVTLHGFVP